MNKKITINEAPATLYRYNLRGGIDEIRVKDYFGPDQYDRPLVEVQEQNNSDYHLKHGMFYTLLLENGGLRSGYDNRESAIAEGIEMETRSLDYANRKMRLLKGES